MNTIHRNLITHANLDVLISRLTPEAHPISDNMSVRVDVALTGDAAVLMDTLLERSNGEVLYLYSFREMLGSSRKSPILADWYQWAVGTGPSFQRQCWLALFHKYDMLPLYTDADP